jgi:hypothetical protein
MYMYIYIYMDMYRGIVQGWLPELRKTIAEKEVELVQLKLDATFKVNKYSYAYVYIHRHLYIYTNMYAYI